MSGSGGQRFRRRAVRRGYKVDEVDIFLDRVEGTLNGVPGAHVTSQEVHDVVFRVRFGGYDEWQVDLHLDRVERQLAELEERAKQPGRGEALRATERPAGPPAPPSTPLPTRPVPQPQRFEPEPAFGGAGGFEGIRRDPGATLGTPGGLGAPVGMSGGPGGLGNPPNGSIGGPGDRPGFGDRPGLDRQGGPDRPGLDRPDGMPQRPLNGSPVGGPGSGGPGGPGGFDGPPGFDPSRHGKTDMTTEIRMPTDDTGRFSTMPPPAPPTFDRPPAYGQPSFPPRSDSYGPGPEFDRPSAGTYGSPSAGSPAQSPFGGPAPSTLGGSPLAPPGGGMNPPAGGGGAEAQRVDQMRRTFQLRRFGSGYDPSQVDRLFDGVLSSLAGHNSAPLGETELDPAQFSLVPGGYYEAEVDAALREVRDIVRRR